MDDAIDRLMACEPLAELFGQRFICACAATEEAERRGLFEVINPWERHHPLLSV